MSFEQVATIVFDCGTTDGSRRSGPPSRQDRSGDFPFQLYAYSLVAVSKRCKTIRTAKSSDQDIQSHHRHRDCTECNYIFHFVHLILALLFEPLNTSTAHPNSGEITQILRWSAQRLKFTADSNPLQLRNRSAPSLNAVIPRPLRRQRPFSSAVIGTSPDLTISNSYKLLTMS